MSLTSTEEAKLRAFCVTHDIPIHVQARSRQIADDVLEMPYPKLKAEVSGAC